MNRNVLAHTTFLSAAFKVGHFEYHAIYYPFPTPSFSIVGKPYQDNTHDCKRSCKGPCIPRPLREEGSRYSQSLEEEESDCRTKCTYTGRVDSIHSDTRSCKGQNSCRFRRRCLCRRCKLLKRHVSQTFLIFMKLAFWGTTYDLPQADW